MVLVLVVEMGFTGFLLLDLDQNKTWLKPIRGQASSRIRSSSNVHCGSVRKCGKVWESVERETECADDVHGAMGIK